MASRRKLDFVRRTISRRGAARLAVGALALPAILRCARANTYPVRPVRIIIGFAAGGSTDVTGRLIAQWLSERLGQPFVVENRPGAGTNIGTEAVINAPADGTTLLFVTPANAINATLYDKLPFNFIRDIEPVCGIMRVPNVMQVHPTFPAKTVAELIAYAKANPGKISHASAGIGSSSHLAGELFKVMTGIEAVHVPYRGNAPALTDLLAGQVQLGFESMPSSVEYIRSGRMRALGLSTAKRSQALPDVPTIGETVPGYESSPFYGIGAPKGTPSEIVTLLNREINAGLADPNLNARFADLGGMMLPGSAADFGRLIADETEKWAGVIRTANIKTQ
ncbi:Bug family tripartite tricarboxylate transporter substrate binding protein [Rhodoplanes sp. Z2-YC6860]|uniref:Bug family tripartite tricarboxylate transporter substrate binding protein n=1 Tax=Rhodoplanes sp. Z2-YC6860 TaxID=674703 RepID=UPI00078DFC50|nr:tripartite tricarboxylate transporter substrate binding protein [Rhodoplanes sp. Z2-YC6860]AMN41822.1 DHA2 family major facilitator superfamily protein [Rhodoplanes sp. Z2-YC6860]